MLYQQEGTRKQGRLLFLGGYHNQNIWDKNSERGPPNNKTSSMEGTFKVNGCCFDAYCGSLYINSHNYVYMFLFMY